MELNINGLQVTPEAGETLRQIVARLGLDSEKLSNRPLAAKIAGEVFTLNYVPKRNTDGEGERPSVRRAMAASNGVVNLLGYGDVLGKEAYIRTAQFVIFLAVRQLWPQAEAKVACTLGDSVYIRVSGAADFSVDRLKSQVSSLVQEDIPLIRKRVSLQQALEQFTQQGQQDKSRLLAWREFDYFDEYTYGDFADYFYGEMVPSTGYLTVWDIVEAEGGFVFVYPDDSCPDSLSKVPAMPNFFSVFTEGERWCELMECETVADLNDLTTSGRIRELIRVNEALHEKRYSQVADMVCQRGARAVMLAGPSSSGKTTSANRLATQLRVHGKKPILMSLDDYYIDRDKIAPGPDGKLDLEHINTLDTDLFRADIKRLLAGEEVELPSFNFKKGRREWLGHKLRLHKDACYNSPAFVAFTKNWIEAVASFGGKKIFWDEPHFKQKGELFSCCCPTCQKLFEEKYGHPMPNEMTDEMKEFRVNSLLNYFDTVCSYAASMGIENSVCVMLHTLDYAKQIMTIPSLNDFGIDPYWHPKSGKRDPYEYVYKSSKQIIAETEAIGKQNHIWIQGYDIPNGHEDEIIVAADAAYDAGARTLISWAFRGSESNTYKSECCERAWAATCEAFRRVRSRHFDAIRETNFKKFN